MPFLGGGLSYLFGRVNEEQPCVVYLAGSVGGVRYQRPSWRTGKSHCMRLQVARLSR